MNKAVLVGRITKDIEVKQTANQVAFTQFTVAVDRRFKDANGNRQADFINCVAWRQTATFIAQYFKKGSKIGIVGTIQTRDYEDKDGKKVYVTEVMVEEAEFVDSANAKPQETPKPEEPKPEEPKPIAPSVPGAPQEGMSEELDLPFDF